jgi:hypothetical protein
VLAALVVAGIGAAIAVLVSSGGGKAAGAAATGGGHTGPAAAGGMGTETGGAMAGGTAATHAGSDTGMAMHATEKGTPTRRLAEFISGQTTWQCTREPTPGRALAAVTCSTKVPQRLEIRIFRSTRALNAAYAGVLRREHAPPRNSGACRADSWGGEQKWFHGEGEPGGRVYCALDGAAASSRVIWTSTVGVPTLYNATYSSLDHRNLYFWWASVRHELF